MDCQGTSVSVWYRRILVGAITLAGPPLVVTPEARAQAVPGAREVETVIAARQTFDQFCGLSIESIPQNMLASAEGIAIFPNMIKGGFILGANYGQGVVLLRNTDRSWSPPVMAAMGGGSIGFQVGVQASDVVLIFATPRSLQGLMNGQKVTLGADASVALGPVGRQANAGTDARLGAEIYSYARSRGLFLGVSFSGAELSIDNNANAVLYGRFGVTTADVFGNRGLAIRPEVMQLVADLNARSGQSVAQSSVAAFPIVPLSDAAPVQPSPAPVAPVGFPSPPRPVAPPTPAQNPTSDPPLVPIGR
ncbi:MAG: lipid-binding SYLF domain-containing protein [Planctomycetaceae bacterium]